LSEAIWKELVRRYADGRPVCNCGEAWEYPCASGIDANGVKRDDMLACRYGCSANLIDAKYEIGRRVAGELLDAVTLEKSS
jgi:hypothetical protein